jgi:hypothetical protein
MIERLGLQVPYAWKGGYDDDYLSRIVYAAKNGFNIINLLGGLGDHPSRMQMIEFQPEKYLLGESDVTRDKDSGDIISSAYGPGDRPTGTPMHQVFTVAETHGLSVSLQLMPWFNLDSDWPYHPYKEGRLTAYGKPSKFGRPGWLKNPLEFFTDPDALDLYLKYADFLLDNLMGPALRRVDILGELAFGMKHWPKEIGEWLKKVAAHLWGTLAGTDVFLCASHIYMPWDRDECRLTDHLLRAGVPGNRIMLDAHYYLSNHWGGNTLQQAKDFCEGILGLYPDSVLVVGEAWPWGGNKELLSTSWQRGVFTDPVTYSDEVIPPDEFDAREVWPFSNTLLWPYLLLTVPRTGYFSRWPGFLLGTGGEGGFFHSLKDMVDIMQPCRGMIEALRDAGSAIPHTIGGEFYFQSMALHKDHLAFMLVDKGEKVVDFGVDSSATWRIRTWNWAEGDVVVDQVMDGSSATLNFSACLNGICVGVLERTDEEPEPPYKRRWQIIIESPVKPEVKMEEVT